MKIVYWSDYACPYCYIGETRLKNAVKNLKASEEFKNKNKNEFKIEIEMKSFQLDPYAPKKSTGDTQTRFANKYGISFDEAGRRIEQISAMGRSEGLNFKYASTLFTNTMDAHRLTKFAREKGGAELTDKIIEKLFYAYFAENQELADISVLQKIGEDAGLQSDEIKKLFSSNYLEDEVRRDELEAYKLGVHGVPFFIIADRYTIPGVVSTEELTEILLIALRDDNNKARPNEQAMACGSEWCDF